MLELEPHFSEARDVLSEADDDDELAAVVDGSGDERSEDIAGGALCCCLCQSDILDPEVRLAVVAWLAPTPRAVQSERWLRCAEYPTCKGVFHLLCLAEYFLRDAAASTLLPTMGACPLCDAEQSWGDVVRRMKRRRLRAAATSDAEKSHRRRKRTEAASGRAISPLW